MLLELQRLRCTRRSFHRFRRGAVTQNPLVDIAIEERERGEATVERQDQRASLDLTYPPSAYFIANLRAYDLLLRSNLDNDMRTRPVHYNAGEN